METIIACLVFFSSPDGGGSVLVQGEMINTVQDTWYVLDASKVFKRIGVLKYNNGVVGVEGELCKIIR